MVDVKDMVLHDLPELYPGSTRPGIERVLQILEQRPVNDGNGLTAASALTPLVPGISRRLVELDGDQVADYLRVLRSATVFVLQSWNQDAQAPSYASIETAIQAL